MRIIKVFLFKYDMEIMIMELVGILLQKVSKVELKVLGKIYLDNINYRKGNALMSIFCMRPE